MKWAIQIQWSERWVTVQEGFASQDEAEWAVAKWRQASDCRNDPFRVIQQRGE